MPQKESHVDSHRLVRLAEKMHDKRYRDGYVATHTRQVLAKQMREFRGHRPQTEFADLIDKRQTMVSRLENPNYSGWTLGTLFEIASKLNVAVFVRFVDFPTFLKYSGIQTATAFHPAAYDAQQVDDFAEAEASRELNEIKELLRPRSASVTRTDPDTTQSRRLATLRDDDDDISAARYQVPEQSRVPKFGPDDLQRRKDELMSYWN